MSALANAIVDIPDPNALGEALRTLTFVGDGFGCYQTFDVRPEAVEWDEAQRVAFWTGIWPYDDEMDPDWVDDCASMGSGYTWSLDGLTVHVCWFWDGDGTLAFDARVGDRRRVVVNTDCKKDYGWSVHPSAAESKDGSNA